MTYYESAKGLNITKERAEIECKKHGVSFQEFIDECGDKEYYDAQFVLRWLGY